MECITKSDIKNYAYKIGIELVGFADPKCLNPYRELLKKRYELNLSCSIEEKSIEKRINPELFMEDVKSIIAIAVSYNIEYKQDKVDRSFGLISKISWGIDYHYVLKAKLEKLIDFIKSKCNYVKAVSLVDNHPLIERAIAYNAGIGWYGKNNLIINDEYGSYIYLGEILINKYFEPDKPVESKCGDCSLCIKACPGKALIGPYTINANKCLSYATVNKGILEVETAQRLGRKIYGCDTCQEVCPFNKTAKTVTKIEFMPDKLFPKHSLIDILNMSGTQFKEVFGPTASSWRGKNTIIRNAIIACANTKDKNCIDSLIKLLNSESPVIRGYSAWALSVIGEKNTIKYIENAIVKETDENAKGMMITALKRIKGDNS